MSNPLRQIYETDQSLETKGVILEYAPGVEITVARAGGANKRFTKVLARLSKPHRVAIRNETISPEASAKMLHTAYAEAIVLNWKGFTKDILTKKEEDADVQLPLSRENVVAVFDALPDLFADVALMSQNISLYRAEEMEHDAGN